MGLVAYRFKEDQAAAAKRHYLGNKDLYKTRAAANNKSARIRNKKFLKEYLAGHPCVDCGESDPDILEFDHVQGDKRNHVTTMAWAASSIGLLQDEIAKCEVRCCNCHRKVTVQRRRAWIAQNPKKKTVDRQRSLSEVWGD